MCYTNAAASFTQTIVTSVTTQLPIACSSGSTIASLMQTSLASQAGVNPTSPIVTLAASQGPLGSGLNTRCEYSVNVNYKVRMNAVGYCMSKCILLRTLLLAQAAPIWHHAGPSSTEPSANIACCAL